MLSQQFIIQQQPHVVMIIIHIVSARLRSTNQFHNTTKRSSPNHVVCQLWVTVCLLALDCRDQNH